MRRLPLLLLALAAIGVAWWWWPRAAPHRAEPPSVAAAPVVATRPAKPAAVVSNLPLLNAPARIAALAEHIAPDAISPIAAELNAPGGSVRRDLEILNEVFGAWQTNFPHDGNPVGENAEITTALAGDNALHFAFISPRHPAINARGELCDRWGTPYWFHQVSGTQMEIHSAGPDRKFGTGDDAVWTPGG